MTISEIFREEPVNRGAEKGTIRRYVLVPNSRSGEFPVYRPGSGSPIASERISPGPTTLDDVWRLLKTGHRVRMTWRGRTQTQRNVFGLENGIRKR